MILSAARRTLIVIAVIAALIAGIAFVVTMIENSRTRDCLQEGQPANACGVELLEQIEDLPPDAQGTQRAMIVFSGSSIAAAPAAQRDRLEGALALVYTQIDDESAECYRSEIVDKIGQMEVDSLAMAVGIKYMELVGAVSNLERPLDVLLSEFDPTGVVYSDLLEKGMAAAAATALEQWAYMHSTGC